MAVVVLALLGGLLASLLTGGSPRHLGQVRLRRWWLLVIALIAQQSNLAGVIDGRLGFAIAVTAAGAFVAVNRGVQGLGLLAVGLVSNFVAVLANGGQMPVSLTALGELGQGYSANDALHTFATSHTRLRFLTDVIAVHLPFGQGGVLSIGDVIVSAGVGLTVFSASRRSTAGAVPKWADGKEGP